MKEKETNQTTTGKPKRRARWRHHVVVTLLAVCGTTHKTSYFDLVMACVVSALIGLVAVILIGSTVGSF